MTSPMTSPIPAYCNLCRGEFDHRDEYIQCGECALVVCASCSRADSDWTSDRYCLKCVEEQGHLKKCPKYADCHNWVLAKRERAHCSDCTCVAVQQYFSSEIMSAVSQPKKVKKEHKQTDAAKPSKRAKLSQPKKVKREHEQTDAAKPSSKRAKTSQPKKKTYSCDDCKSVLIDAYARCYDCSRPRALFE